MGYSMVIKKTALLSITILITIAFLLLGNFFFFLSFLIPTIVNGIIMPSLFPQKKERATNSIWLTVLSILLFGAYTYLDYHYGYLDEAGVITILFFAIVITVIPSVALSIFFYLNFFFCRRKEKEK